MWQAVEVLKGMRRLSAGGSRTLFARVVGPEHIFPQQLQQQQQALVVSVAMAIDTCLWSADTFSLFEILRHPMSFVVELILKKYKAAEEVLRALSAYLAAYFSSPVSSLAHFSH